MGVTVPSSSVREHVEAVLSYGFILAVRQVLRVANEGLQVVLSSHGRGVVGDKKMGHARVCKSYFKGKNSGCNRPTSQTVRTL